MKKIFTTFSLLTTLILNAQTVLPDTTFGTSGTTTLSNQTNGLSVINSIVQPDGKTIVTGMRINGTNNNEVFVARFNANGSLDNSFANAGYCTAYQIAGAYSTNLYLVGDKIVVFYTEQGTLVKLNSDGSPDGTFGSNGILSSTSIYERDNVLIGNYLYAVKNNGTQVFLDKIDISNGSVISSTQISGIVNSTGVVLGPNGKLIVKTTNTQNYSNSLTLVNLDGSVDTSFGNSGSLVVSSFSSVTEHEANYDFVTVDASNNIIYGVSDDNNVTTTIKKYTSAGAVDTTFGTNGTYQLANTIISGLNTLSNKIYISGASTEGGMGNLLLGRLNSNGTLDATFDNDGIFIYNANSSSEWAENFNILSETSIIVAGEISGGTNNSIYIGKFNVTANLATSEVKTLDTVWFENPVKSVLTYKSNEKIKVIEIYSTDGKLLKTITENNASLSVLTKGVYIARITFQNGKITTKKLIKN